jgi:ABC-type multidrug transport system ATPase subunit
MKAGVGIQLRGAGKRFNRAWIFRHLAVSLLPGEQMAIIGHNGSGKSTLLGVLSAYQSLSEGEIHWMQSGETLEREDVYRHISLCAPYLELPDHLTATELFDFHFGLKGSIIPIDAPALLAAAGLPFTGNKLIREYSSGMRQRLKLLLAFYSDSSLLLLDEPTANLDQQGIDWYQELRHTQTAGRSLVIASNMAYEYAGIAQFLSLADYK